MEVGEQRIDDPETVARHDEQLRVAAERLDSPGLVSRRFEQPERGRPGRDHAPSRRPPAADGLSGGGRYLAPFRMHPVVLDALGFHRQEGAGADMEGDGDDPDPARGDPRQQIARQMKPRRRRRDRAGRPRIDRLVVGAVPRVRPAGPLDIGGQGRLAVVFEGGQHIGSRCKAEPDFAVPGAALDMRPERVRDLDHVARAQPPRRAGERAPGLALGGAVERAQQRRFDARLAAPADDAGGDDLGVVDRQHVAGAEQPGQLGDRPVAERRTHLEKPRRLARHGRTVGYGSFGQVEVEIPGLQPAGHSSPVPASQSSAISSATRS